MDSLESLKKKITTAQELLSVVKTMKSLAAVNIRQLEGAVSSLEEYNRIVDLGWQALFRSPGMITPAKQSNRAIYLVLGSDQGMCGPFNEVIVDLVLEKEEELAGKHMETSFWAVGERVRSGLEERGRTTQEYFELPGSLSGINGQVQLVVQTFEAWQREKGVETLYTCFNQLGKGGGYQPVHSRLLPLDQTWLEKYKGQKWAGTCLPLLGLHREELFRHLFRQYLFVSLYRVFAQSMASENAARLNSMQAAEKNILEMEEELQGKFRETRQTMITEELLDIISGFEAMSGAEPSGVLPSNRR